MPASKRFYVLILEEFVNAVLVMFQNAFQKLTINRHAGQNEAAARKACLSLSDPARTGDGSAPGTHGYENYHIPGREFPAAVAHSDCTNLRVR
jgi:hypothetical protein